MKHLIVSMHPESLTKILRGEQTALLQKRSPLCDTPFKCYIYCTNGSIMVDVREYKFLIPKLDFALNAEIDSSKYLCSSHPTANRKIIGEFTVTNTTTYKDNLNALFNWDYLAHRGITVGEYLDYAHQSPVEIWDISNLIIYSEFKKLSDFTRDPQKIHGQSKTVSSAPQTWCYVEEYKGT